MPMKTDFTYCEGKGCGLRNSCTRYLDGLTAANDHQTHSWMEHCDKESRECYISAK